MQGLTRSREVSAAFDAAVPLDRMFDQEIEELFGLNQEKVK